METPAACANVWIGYRRFPSAAGYAHVQHMTVPEWRAGHLLCQCSRVFEWKRKKTSLVPPGSLSDREALVHRHSSGLFERSSPPGVKGIPRCPAVPALVFCRSRFTTTGSWPPHNGQRAKELLGIYLAK